MNTFAPRCAASLLVAAVSAAWADRPLVTEDADVLEPAAWMFEAGASRVKLEAARVDEQSAQLSRGIGWSSQLGLAVARAKAEGETAQAAALIGKTGLWKSGAKNGQSALTLAWAVAGEKSAGRSWRHAATELTLAYTRALPDGFTLHANLGHARDGVAARHSTPCGLALEHDGMALGAVTLAPTAEIFGDDRGERWWNAGLRLVVQPETLFFDTSYGRSLRRGDEGDKPSLWSLGLTLVF